MDACSEFASAQKALNRYRRVQPEQSDNMVVRYATHIDAEDFFYKSV